MLYTRDLTQQAIMLGLNPEEVKGTQEYVEKYFPVVKASTLSFNDEYFRHEPTTILQKEFKEHLASAINSGLSDFRAQRMDPSFEEESVLSSNQSWKKYICFKAGMRPALDIGRSFLWSCNTLRYWKETAKEFMPVYESRLGTEKQRTAFLGLMIKYLAEQKDYSISKAWEIVCDNAKEISNCRPRQSRRHFFEMTGSRRIGEWYDLGNTGKITLTEEANSCAIWGSGREGYSFNSLVNRDFALMDSHIRDAVGWIVLSV